MSKRRRPPKPKPQVLAPAPSRLPSKVAFQLEALEIARGYDGLFRGEPEPVLVVGVFAGARLLGREQVAFTRPGESPRVLLPQVTATQRLKLPRSYDGVTVVCAALEHDDGTAVLSMYSALEKPLRAWRPTDPMPEPHAPEAPEWSALVPHPVELLLDGVDWRVALHGDDVIAATLVRFPTEPDDHEVRLEFRSPDGKNEWTARARLSLR